MLVEWTWRPLNDGNGDDSELNRQDEIRIVVSTLTGGLNAATTALTNHLASYQSRPRYVFRAPSPEHTPGHYHIVAEDEESGLVISWVYGNVFTQIYHRRIAAHQNEQVY
jgi:hypothetical protein